MRILILALLALFVMALPVMAATETDTVDVQVTIPGLITGFDAGTNQTFTITAAGLNAGSQEFDPGNTVSFTTNSNWSLAASIASQYTNYTLQIWNDTGTPAYQDMTTGGFAVKTGAAGSSQTHAMKYKVTGLGWGDPPGSETKTLTFTLTTT